jgi:TetR/AcrR family transcriptional regulator, transcriptional repressor for nem operon
MEQAQRAETTRQRILRTAFEEFYRYGFQAGSLNRIVEETGLTKGALFHHFAGKQELGYAVVDEVIWPHFKEVWIDPLAASEDPIRDTKRIMLRLADGGGRRGSLIQGCPVNNLAQEMSPLDEEFRKRLERIYTEWRLTFKTALTRGIEAGKVRSDISPSTVAAFLVAGLTGIIGTAKNAQDAKLLRDAGAGLIAYLESLRP